MRSLALALLLTGCATAPAHLTAAKNAVDVRLEYAYFKMKNKPPHLSENQENCVGYANAYIDELKKQGYMAVGIACRLPDGSGHMVAYHDGWILDNRKRNVIPVELSQCR